MPRVLADGETLMRQASMTAGEYFGKAIEEINNAFGAGYAESHPKLIAAFMQTAALDFGAAIIAGALEELAEAVGNAAELQARVTA